MCFSNSFENRKQKQTDLHQKELTYLFPRDSTFRIAGIYIYVWNHILQYGSNTYLEDLWEKYEVMGVDKAIPKKQLIDDILTDSKFNYFKMIFFF